MEETSIPDIQEWSIKKKIKRKRKEKELTWLVGLHAQCWPSYVLYDLGIHDESWGFLNNHQLLFCSFLTMGDYSCVFQLN